MIEQILESELNKLNNISNTDSDLSNILYNIIILNNNLKEDSSIYKNTKLFFDKYINSLKGADYGYDNFNYSKINKLLELLSPEQQESILQYIISVTSRELPEYDRSWFVIYKHNAEITKIIRSKKYSLFPKAIMLYFGQSVQRLLLGFVMLFIITSIILLPAPIKAFEILDVTFENFNKSDFFNYLLNVLSLFADLDNDLTVKPMNWMGLLLIIFGKLFFITFITNFIFIRICDKINQK